MLSLAEILIIFYCPDWLADRLWTSRKTFFDEPGFTYDNGFVCQSCLIRLKISEPNGVMA